MWGRWSGVRWIVFGIQWEYEESITHFFLFKTYNYLFLSHRYQCFKSAWMYQVLHEGFHFPYDYSHLQTAQLVYDREVQWTLGAILYKTRFLPLRDLRQEGIRQAHSNWLRLSFVYNHYLFFACILVVLLAIILYLLRLRRIHHRQTRASAPLDLLWIEEVVPMIRVQVGPWGWTKAGEAQYLRVAAPWIPPLPWAGLRCCLA